MDGFVIIDLLNRRTFLYNGTIVKEGIHLENGEQIRELVNQNRNNAFILLFGDDSWENFSEKLKVPRQQIWDWKNLMWGDGDDSGRKLRITVYSPLGEVLNFAYGKATFRGMLREKEVVIGKTIPGMECYVWEEFYSRLIDAAKKRYHSIKKAEVATKERSSQTAVAGIALSAIEDKLSAINKKLDRLLTERPTVVPTPAAPSAGGNEKTEKLLNYIISLLEDSPSGNQSGDDALVSELKTQLEEYKVDLYYKTMRKLGIDAMLDVMEYLYTCMEEDDEQQNVVIQKILKRMERTLRDKLNVRMETSEPGVPFDENKMISYSGDSLPTDDESRHNTVARSVRPAFYWTMPMVNGQGGEYLFKEEVVILYKYQ